MPQAVQNPLTIPTQSSYSSSRWSQAKPSDGSSFQDTLDEVQNKEGEPAESEAAPESDNTKPSAVSKPSKKEPAKKTRGAATDKSTKQADRPSNQADAEEVQDAGSQASHEDQQSETSKEDGQGKPDKKKAPEPVALSGPAVDTVQVQNTAVPVQPQPVAQQKPAASGEPKVGKKAASPAKLQAQAAQKNSKASTKADAEPAGSSNAADEHQDPDAPQADDASQQAQGGQPARRGKQALAIQPRKGADESNDPSDAATDQNVAVNLPTGVPTDAAASATSDDAPAAAAAAPRVSSHGSEDPFLKAAGADSAVPGITAKAADGGASAAKSVAPSGITSAAPEAQFADANHAKIVAGVHGQLLPNGGQMHIRLDPPELGSLHVRVEMKDGVMTASFETTNDHATRLLSHSLSDLKTALESQGVSVDKLQVRQSPKDQQSSGDDRQPDRSQDQARQQEQQRKEMVRRMWAKLMKGSDPLDLVA